MNIIIYAEQTVVLKSGKSRKISDSFDCYQTPTDLTRQIVKLKGWKKRIEAYKVWVESRMDLESEKQEVLKEIADFDAQIAPPDTASQFERGTYSLDKDQFDYIKAQIAEKGIDEYVKEQSIDVQHLKGLEEFVKNHSDSGWKIKVEMI